MLYSHNGEMPEAARSDIHTAKHRSRSYANNKLAQVLHAKELQRRLFSSKGPGIKLRAFSSCPAWASTNILPKNAGGSFVSRAAFRPKAAILGVLGAILDTKTFQGGEFVAVFKNRIMHQWWARPLMKLATQLGVRDALTNILAMFILADQNRHYGYWSENSSAEGDDEELARNLYDWSTQVTDKWAL